MVQTTARCFRNATLVGLFIFGFLLTVSSYATAGSLAFLRGGDIWLANSDGSGARQLTQGENLKFPQPPALSWDGQWVAFSKEVGNKRIIRLVPTGGGPAKTLTLAGIAEAWSPAFTPNGKSLALVTRFNVRKHPASRGEDAEDLATHAVSLVDLPTGRVRHLAQTPNHPMEAGGNRYEAVAVSADGRLLVYQDSFTDVSGGFAVLTLEGQKVFSFPKDPEKDYRPYWRPTFTPDGGKVLCFSMPIREKEKSWIYLVDLKSGGITRITEGYYPTLVDGGQAMVFERWGPTKFGSEPTQIDLWRLDLTPGATPRLILKNAQKPAAAG